MNPSIKNQPNLTKKEFTPALANLLTCPLGEMFSWNCGPASQEVEKVEENTFSILIGAKSAIVCGDTLINLFLGKTNLSTLKFQ